MSPEFWQDEYFFKSTDPLMREGEKRHHPDTGRRVLIVKGRQWDFLRQVVVQEVAEGMEKETQVQYRPLSEISRN